MTHIGGLIFGLAGKKNEGFLVATLRRNDNARQIAGAGSTWSLRNIAGAGSTWSLRNIVSGGWQSSPRDKGSKLQRQMAESRDARGRDVNVVAVGGFYLSLQGRA